MADFLLAFQKVLRNEGGYVNDPDDRGGETYKGVARRMNSKWEGWFIVDTLKRQSGFPANLDRSPELQAEVQEFYKILYWDTIKGDAINNQAVAETIFDFGVNAGVRTSAALAQRVLEITPDGIVGSGTITSLNQADPDTFLAAFTLAKIARYIAIVKRNPVNKKYFYGWIRRAVEGN